MTYIEIDLLKDDSPGYRFGAKDVEDVVTRFRSRLVEVCNPTNADELYDARGQWSSMLLMRFALWSDERSEDDWTPFSELLLDCYILLRTCPDSSFIDKGVDAAITHMMGKMISLRSVLGAITRNLWFLHDFRQAGKDGHAKHNAVSYYYQTLTVMTIFVQAYLMLALNSKREASSMFAPLVIETE